jgi:hypothetical protein
MTPAQSDFAPQQLPFTRSRGRTDLTSIKGWLLRDAPIQTGSIIAARWRDDDIFWES